MLESDYVKSCKRIMDELLLAEVTKNLFPFSRPAIEEYQRKLEHMLEHLREQETKRQQDADAS